MLGDLFTYGHSVIYVGLADQVCNRGFTNSFTSLLVFERGVLPPKARPKDARAGVNRDSLQSLGMHLPRI